MKRGLILSGMLAALVACGDQLDDALGPLDAHTVLIARNDPKANAILNGTVSGLDSSTNGSSGGGGLTHLEGIEVTIYQLVRGPASVRGRNLFELLALDSIPNDSLPRDSVPIDSLPPRDSLPTDTLPTDTLPPTPVLRGTVTTGPSGRFTVRAIPPGEYLLYATPPAGSPWAPSIGWGIVSDGNGVNTIDIVLLKKN